MIVKPTKNDCCFKFVAPPEAPIFSPSEEEFKDSLGYIAKIRPIAENFGICKIKPPPNWQPPFALDVDQLKFTPRIQKLNELEAKTRVKLNFLDQIAKFWELQGSSFTIPIVEKRVLDLCTLYRTVQLEGKTKWAKIAILMGYSPNIGAILKSHYERILEPFEVFKQANSTIKTEFKSLQKVYKPYDIVEGTGLKPSRRSKRFENKTDKNLSPKFQNIGLKHLEFCNQDKNVNFKYESPTKYVCHNCNRYGTAECTLFCDKCSNSYHISCLQSPIAKLSKYEWRCPKCAAEEVSQPVEAFGFEQAKREYTLYQFGEMADQFKFQYFNQPVHTVPTSTVEREFWRIVSSIDEDVTVEYAADLHTMDHGSGFPTNNSLNLLPTDKEYVDSKWNLNNIPVLEGSVLRYINADISGMKIPWMYVGMCFASFCWHIEDHWSYSINYLHWGEPKTWYGVPGCKAESFEETMKLTVPELFKSQPDLLHQLVTLMNPNILMGAGVPVYRTDQHAGEFVITFPRAYHAGFNQGFNLAEAVNFAPASWLRLGRECILHYSNLRRFCVFSHDELVCTMALNSGKLDLAVAAAAYRDMLQMVEDELILRKSLLDWGVTNAEREVFELLSDDERQCEVCKTTCFLSAITCSCTIDILVCLRHCKQLCQCPLENHTLRYRFSLDELSAMLTCLKLKAESFDLWISRVKDTFGQKTLRPSELKELLSEAIRKNFPKSNLLQTLTNAVEDVEKCISVIQQLHFRKKIKLTIQELTLFCEELDSLPCEIEEAKIIRNLLQQTKLFECASMKFLERPLKDCSLDDLRDCIARGNEFLIEPAKLKSLRLREKQVEWIYEVTKRKYLTLNVIQNLIQQGTSLSPHPEIQNELIKLRYIFSLLSNGITENAQDLIRLLEEMNSEEYYPYYNTLEDLVKTGLQVNHLNNYLRSAQRWKEQASREFLLKTTSCTLMEALSPRNTIINLTNNMTPTAVASLFKEAEDMEIKFIKKLRVMNAEKSLKLTDGIKFCICNRGVYGITIQCKLCQDWFHSACVRIPKNPAERLTKFLCSGCFRTKRPRLNIILELLMSLQKLRVRVPEGEVLQCFIERVLNWHSRARQFLRDTKVKKQKIDSFSDDQILKVNRYQYDLQLIRNNQNQLEELVIEGDLLEVHLDETFSLWKLMEAVRNVNKEIVVDFGGKLKRVSNRKFKKGKSRKNSKIKNAEPKMNNGNQQDSGDFTTGPT